MNGAAATPLGNGRYSATISQEGNNVVTIAATGASNSATDTTLRTKIDKSAPTVNASSNPSGWSNAASATVNATASDGLSGLKSFKYRINGIAWLTELIPDGSLIFSLILASSTYEFKAEDNAGNVSDVVTVYVQLDRVDPSCDVDVTPLFWTNAAEGSKITISNVNGRTIRSAAAAV